MATALVRHSTLLMPLLAARPRLQTTRPRTILPFLSPPCCCLHTVVASEDPSGERYKHIVTSGTHSFRGDLSEAWGAGGTAPEPKDYAFAGLAMCSSMTIRLYADRKKWPLRHIQVTVEELGTGAGTIPDGLQVRLVLEGDLTEAQKQRLVEISAKCPVKQMMLGKMPNGITVHLSS